LRHMVSFSPVKQRVLSDQRRTSLRWRISSHLNGR
jgi:hypothetical protein